MTIDFCNICWKYKRSSINKNKKLLDKKLKKIRLFQKITIILQHCFLFNEIASGYMLPKGKHQFISQGYFVEPSAEIKRLTSQKLKAQNLLSEYMSALHNIAQDNTLTPEQKTHRSQQIQNTKINPLEKLIANTPDYLDTFTFVKQIEYGITDDVILGGKITYKSLQGIYGDSYQLVEAEIFNKVQIYQKRHKIWALSPKLIFMKDGVVEYELRGIYFSSQPKKANSKANSKKRWDKFFEAQFGYRVGAFGPKYFIDITNGVKFHNGVSIMLQSFWALDPKNFSEIYRDTSKHQISIAKELQRRNITLQLGYFNHISHRAKLPLASGVALSMWCNF